MVMLHNENLHLPQKQVLCNISAGPFTDLKLSDLMEIELLQKKRALISPP